MLSWAIDAKLILQFWIQKWRETSSWRWLCAAGVKPLSKKVFIFYNLRGWFIVEEIISEIKNNAWYAVFKFAPANEVIYGVECLTTKFAGGRRPFRWLIIGFRLGNCVGIDKIIALNNTLVKRYHIDKSFITFRTKLFPTSCNFGGRSNQKRRDEIESGKICWDKSWLNNLNLFKM